MAYLRSTGTPGAGCILCLLNGIALKDGVVSNRSTGDAPASIASHFRSNRLLAALSEQAVKQLVPELRQAVFPQGTCLFEPGDIIDRVYFPHGGMISLLVVFNDGHAIEASTIGREGAVGFRTVLGLRHSFTRAVVQISGTFSFIAATALEKIVLENEEFRQHLTRYGLLLHFEAQQNSACNAIHSVDQRLSRWILQTSDRVESDALALTQEFLAEMLGVRRGTISLLAGQLQKDGFIEYKRGKIYIRDREGLKRRACECYAVIHRLGEMEKHLHDDAAASGSVSGNRTA
jgi:CRP-like cAMP-binding protein